MKRVMVAMLLFLAGAVCASAQEENLLQDSGFEAKANDEGMPAPPWIYFSSGDPCTFVDRRSTHSGEQALRVQAQKKKFGSHGVAQEILVTGGAKYEYEAFVKNNPANKLGRSCRGRLGVEWIDDGGKEVERDVGIDWDNNLSAMRWERYELKVTAPREAVKARFAIYFYDGDDAGRGSCYVDDLRVVQR